MRRGISGDQILAGTNDRDGKLILGEYLAEGETMLLYAPTSQGKTVNALMLGIACSTGGKFYDWKAREPMPVLFIEGGELTAYGIAERMRAIYRRQGITTDPNFHLKAPTREDPFTFTITDEAQQAVILKYVEEYGIKLVIFDNYNSLRKEADNEFQDWQRLEKMLNRLKARGVASVVVHHTNKEGQQQSGSQRKSDFCDLVLRIQKSRLSTKKAKGDNGKLYVEVEMQKFRWGEEQEIILTELIFKDGIIDLKPADYEGILHYTIKKDLSEFGEQYVKQKFNYLGYKLHHYMPKGDGGMF